MNHLTGTAEVMQHLLGAEADELAVRCGFVKRKRKVGGANFAQAVVFADIAEPDPPRSRLLITAAAVGLKVSRQALERRFDDRGRTFLRELLRAAVAHVVAAAPVAVPLLRRFAAVEVLDSSVVPLPDGLEGVHRGGRSGRGPGAGPKASVKLTVGLELNTGALRGPELSDGRAGDLKVPSAGAAPPPGGLQLADLNYFSLEKFARWQGDGVYWLSRLKSGVRVYDAGGRPVDLVGHLRAAGAADVDLDVRLGGRHRLACRLIARRVPAGVAEVRRRRLREKAADRGDRPSALSLALCDWAVLVTNVPRAVLGVGEAVALARLRWQIELVFKLWKGHGGFAAFRSGKPLASLCEVYGKLIAQVVRHWVIVAGAWSMRDRSPAKAAEIVTKLALSLAAAVRSLTRLRGVLRHARQLMAAAARMEKHGAQPNANDMIFCLDPGA